MTEDSYHNALGGAGADQLRAYVTRVERIEEEIKAGNDDKKEVYAEAKAIGLCVKTLKKVIARRRKDATERAEEDQLLELYEAALAGPSKDPLDD